jgi:hypothetical protein
MRFRLVPFPSAVIPPFAAVEADVWREGDRLQFLYRVSGASALKSPPPSACVRRDGLWRMTCFEAFIRPGARENYVEFNFSPSGDWAAYRFEGYRRGVTNAAVTAPEITCRAAGRTVELLAGIDVSELKISPSARLGLSAILETNQSQKSYWALAHTGDKPDFHRADAFIARLPFESRA